MLAADWRPEAGLCQLVTQRDIETSELKQALAGHTNMPRSKIDRHRDQLLKNTSLEDLQKQSKHAAEMEKTLKGGYSKARRGWKQLKEQITSEIERRSNQDG